MAATNTTQNDATLAFVVQNNWGTGFSADLSVTAGPAALAGWTVEFDADFAITNLWNATILSHVGTHYVIGNAAWNGSVQSGVSVSFGFQATSGPSGATATGFELNGTPVSIDPQPELPDLAIAGTSFLEGSAGDPGQGVFTVTLSAAADGPVTVAWTTGNGTATAGSDYVAASGTLTFAAGETSKTIRVDAVGDAIHEADETFTVTLSAAKGATIATASATGILTNDDAADGGSRIPATGWFSTARNQIVDETGASVQLTGVNWFGFESDTMTPHGLWARGYKDMMDQMADLGFNTIRLPFSSEMLHATSTASGIDTSKSPDLAGLTPLQVMDKIVAYAEEIGLRVILDHHRSSAGTGTSSNGLWYDGQHSEAQWIADWQMLAQRYADNAAVIGADLHNEPYNGTWGDGGVNDWARAATAAGNAIGDVNQNWLIFVEGIGTYEGSNYWWGGNLMGVRDHPVTLDVANKLVYSTHDYPNSVHAQPWFETADFPANLPAKFREMWGYIYEEGIAPVYVGEFGTKLVDPKDAPWLEALTAYLGGDLDNDGTRDIAAGETGPSWTYWSWNPNSGDTGGILKSDWTTVETAKLAYLQSILFDLDAGRGPGGPGDDFLRGTNGNDSLSGAGGNDTLSAGAGIDTLDGGAGLDLALLDRSALTAAVKLVLANPTTLSDGTRLSGIEAVAIVTGSGKDTLTGGAYNDSLAGGAGADLLTGLGGSDTLEGGTGNDTLVGGAGDDILNAGTGVDVVDGGSGFDRVILDRSGYSGAFTLVLGSTAPLVDGTRISGVAAVSIVTGAGRDTLTGGSSDDSLSGGAGDDSLTGRGGNDTLVGGDGADLLDGGAGNDSLVGGAGDDILNAGTGVDVVDGGSGFDRVILDRSGYSGAFTLVLGSTAPLVDGTRISGVAAVSIVTGAGRDMLTGGSSDDSLSGGAGDDSLTGRGGNDTLVGGDGADLLDGGAGNDSLVGGAGDDILNAGTGVDLVDGGSGFDRVILDRSGYSGAFTLVLGSTAPLVDGTRISGVAAVSIVTGAGRDMLTGGSSDDSLSGGAGDDSLTGRGGNDTLVGGAGNDTLVGGGGQDQFVFGTGLSTAGIDRISDFNVVTDGLQLDNAVFTALADGALAASAFRVGSVALDADDRLVYNRTTGALFYDADGSGAGAARQFATLSTGLALTHADFVIL